MKKIVISSIVVTMLCACGVTRDDLGLEKESPDEMMVISRAPLSIPPEFNLRPLTVENEAVTTEQEMSAGEKALLKQMN
ncbi:MAG: DUF3035 domain-containing protein [Alphaproteobacteria bacterium]|nr:DUF3035 domain-containing protein [Alphaproteobacteria bacterium]